MDPSVTTDLSVAGDVARHGHLRVDDEVHAPVEAAQGRDDGVDEEGHVVHDDLHDGVARRPPLVLGRRVEDAHVERADRTLLGEGTMLGGDRRELTRRAGQQVLGRDETVVGAEELLHLAGCRPRRIGLVRRRGGGATAAAAAFRTSIRDCSSDADMRLSDSSPCGPCGGTSLCPASHDVSLSPSGRAPEPARRTRSGLPVENSEATACTVPRVVP